MGKADILALFFKKINIILGILGKKTYKLAPLLKISAHSSTFFHSYIKVNFTWTFLRKLTLFFNIWKWFLHKTVCLKLPKFKTIKNIVHMASFIILGYSIHTLTSVITLVSECIKLKKMFFLLKKLKTGFSQNTERYSRYWARICSSLGFNLYL